MEERQHRRAPEDQCIVEPCPPGTRVPSRISLAAVSLLPNAFEDEAVAARMPRPSDCHTRSPDPQVRRSEASGFDGKALAAGIIVPAEAIQCLLGCHHVHEGDGTG